MMQSDLGKLFVGGISWDTTEERLKEYFGTYGDVFEAVIMKDRATGRARGFGFVVFADPAVAERVIKDKHRIDGRMVEAKKAVPRDDQSTGSRSSGRIQDSPISGQTKKIFVGGLASTVTEGDFKKYFEQFGTITDVVVMYDHNTQRPRGFGFITYDSEDAVDKVLLKTFHELNGKMVEVKRAVPKELSPSPSRSPLGGYNYGVGRINSFLNGYPQGYSPSTMGGYGLRMDGRFSPIAGGRSNFTPFASDYGLGLNYEPGLGPGPVPGPAYGGSGNFNSSLNYGRSVNPYYVNSNSNRFGNSVRFDGGNGGNGGNSSFFSSNTGIRSLWGNGGVNYGSNSAGSSNYMETGSGSIGGGGGGAFGNSGVWGPQGGHNVPSQTGNFGYGGGDNTYSLAGKGYVRNTSTSRASTLSYAAANDSYDGALADLYDNNLGYLDPTWNSTNSEQEGSGSFGYGSKISPGYAGNDGGTKRQIG